MMTENTTKGVYLVVDPSMDRRSLLDKIALATQKKLMAVQVWDNFEDVRNVQGLIGEICGLCRSANVPVLINNRWELLRSFPLDGVHFDEIPQNVHKIRNGMNRKILMGLTCNNDLSKVRWAEKNHFDYISFCSVFPSSTDNSCELVNFGVIRKAKRNHSLPVLLAGGIKIENIESLAGLDFDGVAVISGIMDSDEPHESIQYYIDKLNENENRNH